MQRHGHRIAIANPLTLVGKELQSILNERGIPYAHMELIDTMGGSEGRLTALADEATIVRPAAADAFIGADIVFFCGSAEKNAEWIQRATDDGAFVIDLSHPSSVSGEAVPIVAGVNDDAIAEKSAAISPHPVAIPIALILHQLRTISNVRLCAVSAIQPASEFDQRGLDELFEQTVSALNMRAIPKEVFDRQLAFNLYPAIGGGHHERYILDQLRAVLGRDVPISLSLTQGTIFHGHSLSLFVELDRATTVDEVLAQLGKSAALEVASIDETVATLDAAGRDQALIGRVHADEEVPNTFWIWAVSDNLRRSSALNAALIAEEYVARFGEKPN